MAAALSRYMKDWQNKVKRAPRITPGRFNNQLARALAAFESKRQTQNTEAFDPSSPSPLRVRFEENIQSNGEFLHFVPWTVEDIPWTILKMSAS
jgi:hypothetical protein